jgi:hypothetical protein
VAPRSRLLVGQRAGVLPFPGSILLSEVSMQRTGHVFLDDF